MSSRNSYAQNAHTPTNKRQLQRLRRAAGYSSAKELALLLGIPLSTYSRYERQPEAPETCIPVRAAWALADVLGASIDLVVGREDMDAPDPNPVQRRYEALSKSDQQRMDEYLDFIESTASERGR